MGPVYDKSIIACRFKAALSKLKQQLKAEAMHSSQPVKWASPTRVNSIALNRLGIKPSVLDGWVYRLTRLQTQAWKDVPGTSAFPAKPSHGSKRVGDPLRPPGRASRLAKANDLTCRGAFGYCKKCFRRRWQVVRLPSQSEVAHLATKRRRCRSEHVRMPIHSFSLKRRMLKAWSIPSLLELIFQGDVASVGFRFRASTPRKISSSIRRCLLGVRRQ